MDELFGRLVAIAALATALNGTSPVSAQTSITPGNTSAAPELRKSSPGEAESRLPDLPDFFRVDDSSLSDRVISPDGELAAYTRQIPLGVGKEPDNPYIYSMEGVEPRRDVWIARSTGEAPENITHAEMDGAGFWAPLWSPNGAYLTMLSTRGGRIRRWVWERASKTLRPLSNSEAALHEECVWLSNTRLFFVSPTPTAYPIPPTTRALVATDLNLSSTDVTASVLESGAEAQEATIDAELVEVDVLSGKQTVLATTVGFERRGFYQIASVSPDRRWIAFLRQTGVQKLQNDIPLYGIDENNDPLLDRLYEVMVVDGEGASSPKVLQGSASTSMAPFRKAIVWSEDDGSLAVRSFNGDRTDSVQTWRACVLRTGTCQLLIAKSQSFRSYSGEAVWSKMALFVHGTFGALRSEETYPIPSMSLRDRLWRVDADRTVHLFCAQDQVNIDALEALPGSSDFVGLSNGDLWKIDRDGHLLQDLTPELKGGIVAVVDVGPALNAEYQVKVGTTTPHFYRFDLHALQLRPMDESWTTEGASPDKLASFPVRVFTYQTLGNETVKAKLIFPPDYKPGSRYPTVVIVYPKNIDEDVGDRTEGIDPEERGEVFASHGYVVLEPSMPHFRIIVEWQPPQRFTANWYKEVTNGVLPAIDELVEQGIADPACLGVFGESYGGYVVNALISQTDRFKAAVSLSGISDLISFYGSLRTDAKYGASYYHEPLAGTNLESAHRLDGPPWKEFANYWTQSPIAYADRINTPLMLIHGDMDPLPIGQAEELFVAMKRQNKRAEFVRYWGDRHCIASPANVLDMYTRIYAWFDEFLRPRNASISKAPGVE